jgi:hypothetical protein
MSVVVRARVLRPCLACCLAFAPGAQGRMERALEDFKQDREKVLVQIGQRHLEYGLALRDQGLTLQAAAQIVQSVDASLGRNQTAKFVLQLMRSFQDAFWKRNVGKPTRAKLEAYERRAQKLRQEDLEDRAELAKLALHRQLEEVAFEELSDVLLALDEPLAFDEKGLLRVAGETFTGGLAERVKQSAIVINDKPYVRDTFLRRVPSVLRVFEASSNALRVRSTAGAQEAADLHAATSALLPILYAELGTIPERRLQLVVLHKRTDYRAYLDIAGLSSYGAADGFADRMAGTAVLCRSEGDDAYVLGLALHELTHLVQLCASPAAFPSWYMEGCAETHGGQGTFRWDGTRLETGLVMLPARLMELRAAPLQLSELFQTNGLAKLGESPLAGRRFYAQSWAFVRFLEQGAGPEIAERFERWRTMCLGAVLGADLYKPYEMDAAKSQELFEELFAKDLPKLEVDFRAWLAAL